MVRCITYGLLALFVGLGPTKFAPDSSDLPNWIPAVLILAVWFTAFQLCDQGRFADYLAGVDQENSQIIWPNRSQMTHAAALGLSIMALLAGGLYCVDWFVGCCLEFFG